MTRQRFVVLGALAFVLAIGWVAWHLTRTELVITWERRAFDPKRGVLFGEFRSSG